ncbi:MerR family transcriptional regulator [Bacillus marasmi]|uniref:MerR family transcriptional regulator n=1 Tax=Bacillus marasmi TaxID=1926279 RepID=UPI0011C8E10B|nr:MerR family transcriptional regulator [Bacillus marasmi]
MNTSEVAKLLGVSVSTIKRWVKQLGLQLERNERGHYQFNDEAIDYLKFIQGQINSGILLHEIAPLPEKTPRTGTIKAPQQNDKVISDIVSKIESLEQKINQKADSVATYQLLQHRREIEDLQELITSLTSQIEELEEELSDLKKKTLMELPLVLDHQQPVKTGKKKNIFSSIFGF